MESRTLLAEFDKLPGVRVPLQATRAIRLDYGPEAHLGRSTTLPAIVGEEYPALVSDIDEDRNEIAGIRLPDVAVPMATYTGWSLRDASIGNPELYIGITGGLAGWTLPFPATSAERESAGDPRLSIEERYGSRRDYLERVETAARALVEEGYMLAEDVDRAVDGAALRFDFFTKV